MEGGRERDFDRFLTFLDAVVAIAITLLVLPLVEVTDTVRDGDPVGTLLADHQAQIWAFLLSFVVIARLWFAQHRSVRHVLVQHDHVARLLMLWALTIVFLPFPTALVAEAPHSPVTKTLYLGAMVASTLLLGGVEAVVARHPELTDGHDDADPLTAVTNALALLVALVISLLVPAASYFPLLLLLAADPAARAWRRLRRGGSAATSVGD